MGQGLIFAGLAFELVGLCLGGYFLGEYVDQRMMWKNTASTYLVVALLFGWFVHLIYMLRRFEKENDDGNPQA